MKNSKPLIQESEITTSIDNSKDNFLIVGIGASAGGIQAMQEFFSHVPADSDMAYVVILHLSPDHDSRLAEVLQGITPIAVTQVTEKVHVLPNHVYVVSPNRHLTMEDGCIIVSPNTQTEERRAPVDIFFRTLAEQHSERAVAVILSGTGANGSMGLKRVKEKGGAVFVQNPREAEYSDMPRNAIATELTDEILNVAEIPAKIIRYKKSIGSVIIPVLQEDLQENQQAALREIFTLLRVRTNHDFSNYKRATVLRRIERRINVQQLDSLSAYVNLMRDTPEETQALLKDLLISVTNFFRDKESFIYLEKIIIPRILANRTSSNPVRIWIAGCATGEEAYSLAMLFYEKFDGIKEAPPIQIFASDIDEAAITKAREGFYTLNDAADVSLERLRRFFTVEPGGYRIRKELREMILFANHNVIKDPPFSHIDIITCRNMLIYLNQTAQNRVMETFHFALNPGCFLFLGSSESIDGANDLYLTLSKEYHVFQSREATTRPLPIPENSMPSAFKVKLPNQQDVTSVKATQEQESRALERISLGDLHQRLLEQYAPPSLIVNENGDILHLSESAGNFLQVTGGTPSNNILKLIKPEVRLELRTALYQAKQQQTNIEVKNLPVIINGETRVINLHVRPVLHANDTARGFMLVIFEPSQDKPGKDALEIQPGKSEPFTLQLEEEITGLKTQLRSSNEQFEIQTEELKASNEELQAMNEELRSAAEELETSKEELQSINEELITVNQELKVKIEELSQSNNDFLNLINSTSIGTIFLDKYFRVKLFTPAVREIFNLIPADIGRPLTDITNKLDYAGILQDAEDVLKKLQTIEREVAVKENLTYLMQLSPYRTSEDLINGVVISFVNITRLKHAEEEMRKSEERLRITVDSAFDYAIINTNKQGLIESWNSGAERIFNYKANEIIGKSAHIVFTNEDQNAGIPEEEMKTAREKGVAIDERWHQRKDGSLFYMSGIMRPIYNPELIGYVKVARDMTEQKKAEENLKIFEERYRIALQSADIGTWDWNVAEDKITLNEKHYTLLGLEPDNEQKNLAYFLRFIHKDDVERLQKDWQKQKRGSKIYHHEFRIIRADDGQVRWMNGYGKIVATEGEKVLRMVGVIFDITERKKLEQQKEDFISIASHELKTPVTSIKAYTELLHDMFNEADDVESANLMEKLDVQVDRLIELINALLDTSKIDEGELILNPEEFDLNKLVKERVEDLQRLSSAHRLIISTNKETFITADRERIGQVLTNFISNAIKYSPNGGDVTITWKQNKDTTEISVSDEGIGISEEVQQKVFDRFFRVKNAQLQNYPGMGLGLYITANIIYRHGGKIWVKSTPGKGSVFYFSLPGNK